MRSLAAFAAFFLGLLLVPAVPVLGAAIAIAGAVAAGRAVHRGDDFAWMIGLAIGVATLFTVWQTVVFIAQALR